MILLSLQKISQLVKFAPLRSALVRSAPVRSAPVRSAPIRFAPFRFAPVRFAFVSFAPFRFTSVRFALVRFKPKNEKQRKTYITDVEEATLNNIPYNVELPDSMKAQDNWQMFIDENGSKLYFIVCCHDNCLSENIEILNIDCDSDVSYNLNDENNLGCQWVKSIAEFSEK